MYSGVLTAERIYLRNKVTASTLALTAPPFGALIWS